MCVISYASHLVANQNVILDLVTEAWALAPFMQTLLETRITGKLT